MGSWRLSSLRNRFNPAWFTVRHNVKPKAPLAKGRLEELLVEVRGEMAGDQSAQLQVKVKASLRVPRSLGSFAKNTPSCDS